MVTITAPIMSRVRPSHRAPLCSTTLATVLVSTWNIITWIIIIILIIVLVVTAGHLVAELGDELRLDPEGADGDEPGESVGEVGEHRGAAQTLQPLQLPRGASGDTQQGQKAQKSAKKDICMT